MTVDENGQDGGKREKNQTFVPQLIFDWDDWGWVSCRVNATVRQKRDLRTRKKRNLN